MYSSHLTIDKNAYVKISSIIDICSLNTANLRLLIFLQDWKVRLVVNNYMEEKEDSNVIGVRKLRNFAAEYLTMVTTELRIKVEIDRIWINIFRKLGPNSQYTKKDLTWLSYGDLWSGSTSDDNFDYRITFSVIIVYIRFLPKGTKLTPETTLVWIQNRKWVQQFFIFWSDLSITIMILCIKRK